MPPYVVVDASVAGAWSFAETYSVQAQGILDAVCGHRVTALAPGRFVEEVIRLCQKKTQPAPVGAAIAPDDAWNRFLDVVTSPIVLIPSDEVLEHTWQIAMATGLTTHDALYLATAALWGAELWTLDAALAHPSLQSIAIVRDLRTEAFPY